MNETPPGYIGGRVAAKDGWPIAESALTVLDGAGRQVARANSDEMGVVVAGPLPPATYTAIVSGAGFEPAALTVRVPPSDAARLGVLTLQRSGDLALPEPGVWTIDPQHSSISFAARHLGLSGIRGRFTEFHGSVHVGEPVERSTVSAEIKAASIDTDNTMRDRHLRSADFLDAEAYPLLEYSADSLTALSGQRWTVDGHLSLHGVVRAVPLELGYLGVVEDPWGGLRIGFHATAELRRDDFGIRYDARLLSGMIQVGTTIRIDLEIQAVRGDTIPGT